MQTNGLDRRQGMSAISTEAGASGQDTRPSAELASYLVTVELRGNGEARTVGLVCEARSRRLAEQIACDIYEDERHVYVHSLKKISELQIVYPLTWDARSGLVHDGESRP
jgi:hypothetical protein